MGKTYLTPDEYKAKGWKPHTCFECNATGQISDYGCGDDFYGPKECDRCGGSGGVWRTPKGHYVQYPGGKFC